MAVSYIILLVDDSLADRQVCHRYLQSQSDRYTILEAETGEEALSFCEQCQPDVILLDYFLPDYDGIDLFALLKDSLGYTMPPTVMMTKHRDQAMAVEAIQAGIQDYLVKDQVTPDLLQRTLKKVLEEAGMRRSLQQQQNQQQLTKDLALRILQSLELSNILDTTVQALGHCLKADRVLVLQFATDGSSTVVAESVQEAWTQSLGQTLGPDAWVAVPDPSLDAIFQQLHQDIWETETHNTTAHWQNQSFFATYPLEILAQWQVKSLHVVPIWVDCSGGDRPDSTLNPTSFPLTCSLLDHQKNPQRYPWGLLMVHQCEGSRSWEPLEINLLQELAIHLTIAIQQAELYQYQAQLNNFLQRQVTQQQKDLDLSQQRLQQQQHQLEAILWACPDLVIHMHRDGRYLDFLNDCDRGMILPPKAPLEANTVFDVFSPPIAQQYLHYAALALDSQTLQIYEQFLEVEGQVLRKEVRIVPCGDADEVVIMVRELPLDTGSRPVQSLPAPAVSPVTGTRCGTLPSLALTHVNANGLGHLD